MVPRHLHVQISCPRGGPWNDALPCQAMVAVPVHQARPVCVAVLWPERWQMSGRFRPKNGHCCGWQLKAFCLDSTQGVPFGQGEFRRAAATMPPRKPMGALYVACRRPLLICRGDTCRVSPSRAYNRQACVCTICNAPTSG